VILWWGLFDQELFVEHGDRRFGPFGLIGGLIPLHRYRAPKKTKTEERLDRIEALAAKLGLPRAVVDGGGRTTGNGGFLAQGRASTPGSIKLSDERPVFWLRRGRADRRKSHPDQTSSTGTKPQILSTSLSWRGSESLRTATAITATFSTPGVVWRCSSLPG
jgi:hypothetical protein